MSFAREWLFCSGLKTHENIRVVLESNWNIFENELIIVRWQWNINFRISHCKSKCSIFTKCYTKFNAIRLNWIELNWLQFNSIQVVHTGIQLTGKNDKKKRKIPSTADIFHVHSAIHIKTSDTKNKTKQKLMRNLSTRSRRRDIHHQHYKA